MMAEEIKTHLIQKIIPFWKSLGMTCMEAIMDLWTMT